MNPVPDITSHGEAQVADTRTNGVLPDGTNDVSRLIADIFKNHAAEEIPGRIAGLCDLVVVDCSDVLNPTEMRLIGVSSEPIQSLGVSAMHFDTSQEFEHLVGFFHSLSLHSGDQLVSRVESQKYIELLGKISDFLSSEVRQRLEGLTYIPSGSRQSFVYFLSQAGLLPQHIIADMFTHREKNSRADLPAGLTVAYKGLLSYKKLFEGLLLEGAVPPKSEKIELTNQEYLLYVKEVFAMSLYFLRRYFYYDEVWKYIQSQCGDEAMRSFYREFESLEEGYNKRIARLELVELTRRDFSIFYEGYVTLVNRLLEGKIHPHAISLKQISGQIDDLN